MNYTYTQAQDKLIKHTHTPAAHTTMGQIPHDSSHQGLTYAPHTDTHTLELAQLKWKVFSKYLVVSLNCNTFNPGS